MRLYPLKGVVHLTGTIGVDIIRGGWVNAGGSMGTTYAMSLDKADETATGYENQFNFSTGDATNAQCYKAWVFPLPAATFLNGTLQVCLPAAGDNRYIENLGIHAYVTVGTTGAVRGTLLNTYIESAGINEIPTAATAVAMVAPQTVAPVAGEPGDYIVIEVGFVFRGPSPNNGFCHMWHGPKTTSGVITPDLAPGDLVNTTIGSGAAWVEFLTVTSPVPDDLSTPCEPGEGGTGTPPSPLPVLQPWSPECIGGGLVPIAAAPGVAELW